ncbi:MAG: isochorismatase family protein [Anaerolineae bacterium]|nr:isochorismatase family protein [Anaerolineae bacterium]
MSGITHDLLQLSPENSILVLVDFQTRMIPAIPPRIAAEIIRNVRILTEGIKVFKAPVLLTEQYPKGLGATIPELRQVMGDQPAIEKVVFSSYQVEEFKYQLENHKRNNIIIGGIETHVCVLQTVLDLINAGYHVFVAADATCSRTKFNWITGINLMREAGAVVVSTETILFQLLKSAGSEQFKQISKLVK